MISIFVKGCKNTSFYGSNCDRHCPTNCENRTCHIQSGSCFNCKPGWTGTYCNTSRMAICMFCNVNSCFHLCIFLSVYTFFPIKVYHFAFCITACRGGRYGINCSNQCSGHCKDGATCNHVTGYCDKGCDAGWKGNFCNEGKIYFSSPASK